MKYNFWSLNFITVVYKFGTFQGFLFNRPGVTGAVLQTPLSLIDGVGHPFVKDLENTVNPKP